MLPYRPAKRNEYKKISIVITIKGSINDNEAEPIIFALFSTLKDKHIFENTNTVCQMVLIC
jgi:predicted metal-dependent peptidase